MEYIIKETCGCGAQLDFAEFVDYPFLSKLADRQSAFHKAHEKCRDIIITNEPAPQTTPQETNTEEKGAEDSTKQG